MTLLHIVMEMMEITNEKPALDCSNADHGEIWIIRLNMQDQRRSGAGMASVLAWTLTGQHEESNILWVFKKMY